MVRDEVHSQSLLYLKRDAREWFGYLTLDYYSWDNFSSYGDSTKITVITVGIIYTIMFAEIWLCSPLDVKGNRNGSQLRPPCRLAGGMGQTAGSSSSISASYGGTAAGTRWPSNASPAIILSVSLGAVLITRRQLDRAVLLH